MRDSDFSAAGIPQTGGTHSEIHSQMDFQKFVSETIQLPQKDINTDDIIPARFMKTTTQDGLGQYLFDNYKDDPKFPKPKGERILVAGKNFGCGSSREHAPWAMKDAGIDVVIASEIADIFRGNAEKNGILPILLPEATVQKFLSTGEKLTVDLMHQQVIDEDGKIYPFHISVFAKKRLMENLSDLDFLMEFQDEIAEFDQKQEQYEWDPNPKKNIIDRIWETHIVHAEENAPNVVFIDQQFLHEVTSPQAFNMLRKQDIPFAYPQRTCATIDHSIPTDKDRSQYPDPQSKNQVEQIRTNCKEFDIDLFDVGSGYQGVCHVISPELGITQPGRTIVCGDSHTATHGAFGAMAAGIGTTQISHVMATQTLLLDKPKTMKIVFKGTPSKYFTAKDAILALINKIGIQGGTGYAMEFCGEYIKNLSMEGRMTISNMTIECGAKYGLVSPDEKTFEYIRNTKFAPENFDEAVIRWKKLASSEEAEYDTVVEVDITNAKPFVTWGTNPEQSVQVDETVPNPAEFTDSAKKLAAEKALDYIGLQPGDKINGLSIDYVFVGSCTNGRIEDLREAAKVMEGKKCAEGVRVCIVPGSEKVKAQAIAEGLDKIFLESGAEFREPGCSFCLAMNGDVVPEGKRCASTSNRNFVGRQGPGSFTHLMSPMMAGMAAIRGEIVGAEKFFND